MPAFMCIPVLSEYHAVVHYYAAPYPSAYGHIYDVLEIPTHAELLLSENSGNTIIEKVAKEIIGRVGKINAIEIANIINAYDPELVTIGGSVATNNQEWLLNSIEKYAKSYTINKMPKIALTPLGNDVGIYGAVAGFLYFDGKGIL